MENTGKLALVPTPIGNLEDITLRALRYLKECDVILAEDTRTSGTLLKHFEISTPMFSYHAHNEHQVLKGLIEKMKGGSFFSLITDAGTPGLSDPGFLIVRECIKEGIVVESLPGASALLPALTSSGLPTDRFVFEGFLPLKKGRQTILKQIAEEKRTVVIYESPHRILKTLEQLGEYCGQERTLCVARELSKKFEEIVRGSASAVTLHFQNQAPKGEFVVVIEGKP